MIFAALRHFAPRAPAHLLLDLVEGHGQLRHGDVHERLQRKHVSVERPLCLGVLHLDDNLLAVHQRRSVHLTDGGATYRLLLPGSEYLLTGALEFCLDDGPHFLRIARRDVVEEGLANVLVNLGHEATHVRGDLLPALVVEATKLQRASEASRDGEDIRDIRTESATNEASRRGIRSA